MKRNFFKFSRLRKPTTSRQGGTATDGMTTTTHIDSHGGLSGPSQDDSRMEEVVFQDASMDEIDRLVLLPSTQKAGNHKNKNVNANANAIMSPALHNSKSFRDPRASGSFEWNERATHQGIILELQNSLDFLKTKLQQSESRAKALEARNEQLQNFLEGFLKHQDIALSEGDSEDLDSLDDATIGLFDGIQFPKLKWPSFAADKNTEKAENDENDPLNAIQPNNGFSIFTKEAAMAKMNDHYQEQMVKLLKEKAEMQKEIKQLRVQNTVQNEAMTSLEKQLFADRKQHQSFFNQQQQHQHQCIQPSSSRLSKSSTPRRKYWQQIEQTESAYERERQQKQQQQLQDNTPRQDERERRKQQQQQLEDIIRRQDSRESSGSKKSRAIKPSNYDNIQRQDTRENSCSGISRAKKLNYTHYTKTNKNTASPTDDRWYQRTPNGIQTGLSWGDSSRGGRRRGRVIL